MFFSLWRLDSTTDMLQTMKTTWWAANFYIHIHSHIYIRIHNPIYLPVLLSFALINTSIITIL